MADEAIVDRALQAAPKNYTVGGGMELALKAVRAAVDGSGAGGSFLPVFQLVAPDGTVMFTAKTPSSFAAGESADVTWFPGVADGGGGTITGGLMAAKVQIVGDFAIADDDPGTLITWGEAAFDLGSPSAFWNAGTPRRLFAPVSGYYMSIVNPIWDIYNIALNNFSQLATYLYKNTETVTITTSVAKVNNYPVATQDYSFPGQVHPIMHLNAGDYLVVNAYVNSGGGGGASTSLLDLRTHVGQPPLVTAWSLVLLAAG